MRVFALVTLVAFAGIAGCVSDESTDEIVDQDTTMAAGQMVDVQALMADNMMFNESLVGAVALQGSLYEPTMEVSRDGAIFITGHTTAVDTTGAPVYGSWDNGTSWSQLPWFQDQQMPADLPGATPPVTDEIFLVAGDNGWLYGVDITLATFPVNAWSQDGRMNSYHNPNAYDEQQVVLQADECAAAPAKDRPWAAFGNDKLLMVSNPAAGPTQIGVLDVPSGPLGLIGAPAGVGATTGGGRWNVCAGIGYHTADNAIPGIPDMRDDGFFAVPQLGNGYLYLTTGNANDIFALTNQAVFPHSSGGEITSVYGQASFDLDGTLFVGITQNSAEDDNGTRMGNIRIASSTNSGLTFEDKTFVTGPGAIRHLYMDGNRFGSGSFMVWAVDGETINDDGNAIAYDWYAAHVQLDAMGAPMLENVSQIIDEGLRPSAHVTGAAVGPDGRGYTAMYDGSKEEPLSVFIQEGGATMPVA
jgi:hypothetical protein